MTIKTRKKKRPRLQMCKGRGGREIGVGDRLGVHLGSKKGGNENFGVIRKKARSRCTLWQTLRRVLAT